MLSIIVPCYNSEKTIIHCLESIVRQSFHDYEIVVIDDGSTDSSGKLIDDFFLKHENVFHTVIHQENIGLPLTRKVGIENSSGDIIGFVDSDDWIEPHYYERLMKKMEETNADVVVAGVLKHESGKTTQFPSDPSLREMDINAYQAALYMLNNEAIYMYAFNKIYKKGVFENVSFYSQKYIGEDFILVSQVLDAADKVSTIDYDGYHYIISSLSQTQQRYGELHKGLYEVFEDHYQKCLDKDEEYIKALERYMVLHYMFILVTLARSEERDPEIEREILSFVRKHHNDYLENTNDGLKAKMAVRVALTNYPLFRTIAKRL